MSSGVMEAEVGTVFMEVSEDAIGRAAGFLGVVSGDGVGDGVCFCS